MREKVVSNGLKFDVTTHCTESYIIVSNNQNAIKLSFWKLKTSGNLFSIFILICKNFEKQVLETMTENKTKQNATQWGSRNLSSELYNSKQPNPNTLYIIYYFRKYD